MGVSEILAQIDSEIARLEQARALLNGAEKQSRTVASAAPRRVGAKKRNLSPEGRKRIIEAVKRRWAEQKKASPGR